LDDGTARFLTCVLLFLVLFYVYPLKFLFNLSITGLLLGAGPPISITGRQFSILLVIYGLGFAAVYGAMTLLYLHAWRVRDALELNELEKFDTRYVMFRLVTLTVIGIIAAGLACISVVRDWSTLVYLLLFPILRTSRIIHSRRRERYLNAVTIDK
jgi:hypothetical protein